MNIFDVITIGGATRDITFHTREGQLIKNPVDPTRQKLLGFEYGAKVSIEDAFFTFGGGATNTAVCFSRLGFKTTTIIRVGDDENGQAVIQNLKKNKVDTKFVQIDRKAKTGFSFIVTFGPAREHTAFLYRGANNNLKLKTQSSNLKTKWVYVSSLSGSSWRGVMDKVINIHAKLARLDSRQARLARLDSARLAWNPGSRQLKAGLRGLKKYLQKTDILFLNKDEAIELVISLSKYKKMKTNWLNKPANLFKVLIEYGPKILVITDGRKGAYTFDGKKIFYQKALSKKIVDTTGAGDSFNSSFVAGYVLYKGNIAKALKLGAVNSAYNLTGIGAQEPLFRRIEAERRMKRN